MTGRALFTLAHGDPLRVVLLNSGYGCRTVGLAVVGDRRSDPAVAICYVSGRSGYAAARRGQDQAQQERLRPVRSAG